MSAADKARQAAHLTVAALWPARRRYALVGYPSRRAWLATRARSYLAGIVGLPAAIKAAPGLPRDTGAGRVVRWEHGAWVVRPATGWRSWRWPPRPLRVNRELGPDAEDAEVDWALGDRTT
jgi:hypothetical protein